MPPDPVFAIGYHQVVEDGALRRPLSGASPPSAGQLS